MKSGKMKIKDKVKVKPELLEPQQRDRFSDGVIKRIEKEIGICVQFRHGCYWFDESSLLLLA